MAEVAVQLLLERLSSLIVEEGKLLGGVGRDVEDIKDDLEAMRSFLRDADSRGETGEEGVKTWVKQVRDVAYDIEDVLDEFLLRLVRTRKNGIFDSLLNKLHCIKHLITRHRLATKIQNIKAKLKAISERRREFSFTDIGEGITRATTTPNAWYDPRIEALYINETQVVGIEVPKNTLIEWLTKRELKLTIISVVGMGGLGKTTLVKKVYDSQIVNKHFDCHVWITVSKSPAIGELLRTAFNKVLKVTKEQAPEGMDAMDNNELIEVLKNQLQKKRYVVIFDDIWDINVWEAMKFAFPNCNRGSRIIFTTRIGNIAERSNYVHNLEPLKEQEAWKLFCMKAFGSNHDDNNSGCPDELKELSRNILKRCSGLPLAIVLIGGLLARKAKTILEWKNIHDSLGAEMRNDYDLESLSKILLLSYNNLPYYLKPCFMYLSMFPEDYFIRRVTVIRMWIAEGFVKHKQGVTMEVVAGGYINELISRSMIQIAELSKCDEVKSCRIHDLMRESIQSKCKEECFSSTTMITGSQEEEGMGYLNEKARRISIYHNNNNTGENKYNYNNSSMGSRCTNIRSLMVFQLDGETPTTSCSFQRKFFNAFRLLRVLDLKGAGLVEFPAELVELIHLRYLSLRNTSINVLPKLVGKLKNLETLDLKKTLVSELPVEIFKLQRLRHLLVYRSTTFDLNTLTNNRRGVSVSTGRIGNLTCLQKLSYLDVHDAGVVVLKELGMLTQLRRLGIMNLRSKDGRHLCLALEKMKHLHSLEIESSTTTTTDVNKEEFLELESLVSPPQFLRHYSHRLEHSHSLEIERSTTTTTTDVNKEFLELESLVSPPQFLSHLYLEGRLKKLPVWIANSLGNLTALGLRYSRLSRGEDDPLEAFQHMPNLMYLNLLEAYDGPELCCSKVGGYPNLKKLLLRKMEGLKRVRFRKGSMPMLRMLDIWNCPALEMVPLGIEHLNGLQELNLYRMHPELVKRIRKGKSQGVDCWKVQHISTIKHFYHNRSNTQGSLECEDLQ